MRRSPRLLLLLGTLAAVGCQSTNDPVAPPEDVLIERTARSLGMTLQSRPWGPDLLVGRATTTDGGRDRVVEVLAVNTRRGAFGRYRVTLPSLDLFFAVDVTCLTVEGNTAWVAGIIAETNASFIEVGTVSYFYAIDNGPRGGVGDPDIVSTARINDAEGEDVAFCEDTLLLLPEADVVEGGVLVR